jgi:N-acetylglucosamine-6-phosphate deacetylase
MNNILNCIECISGKGVELTIRKDKLNSLRKLDYDLTDNLYIGPGLIDIQINGFAGVDFNQPPVTEEKMMNVIHALVKEGVTTFFPTIITNSIKSIKNSLSDIDEICNNNKFIDSFIGGIHLEGPFISPLEGLKQELFYRHI